MSKQDVIVAKNYLSVDEVDTLNRLVVIFLEQAEAANAASRAVRKMFLKIQNGRRSIASCRSGEAGFVMKKWCGCTLFPSIGTSGRTASGGLWRLPI